MERKSVHLKRGGLTAVSYTHLDVYKRQAQENSEGGAEAFKAG